MAVLGVYAVPAVMTSLLSYTQAIQSRGDRYFVTAAYGFVHASSILAFGFFVLWRSGERADSFGLVRPKLRLDLLLAVAACLGRIILSYAYAWSFYYLAPDLYPRRATYDFGHPTTQGDYVATFLHALCNGTAEELMLWGILYTRLNLLTGKRAAPAVGVAALFASYHLYQGPYAVGAVLLTGLLHAVLFVRFRRLAPLMLAHVLADMVLLWR